MKPHIAGINTGDTALRREEIGNQIRFELVRFKEETNEDVSMLFIPLMLATFVTNKSITLSRHHTGAIAGPFFPVFSTLQRQRPGSL